MEMGRRDSKELAWMVRDMCRAYMLAGSKDHRDRKAPGKARKADSLLRRVCK